MKKIVHILLLGILILFSFGVTAFQSTCVLEEEVITSTHSCCDTTQKETKEHKNKTCCDIVTCDGECCLQSFEFLQINDFVCQFELIEVSELEMTLIPTIHNLLVNLQIFDSEDYQSKLGVPPDLISVKSTSKQILLKKQTWLI